MNLYKSREELLEASRHALMLARYQRPTATDGEVEALALDFLNLGLDELRKRAQRGHGQRFTEIVPRKVVDLSHKSLNTALILKLLNKA